MKQCPNFIFFFYFLGFFNLVGRVSTYQKRDKKEVVWAILKNIRYMKHFYLSFEGCMYVHVCIYIYINIYIYI